MEIGKLVHSSTVGEHVVVTQDGRTRVFLGAIKDENIVDAGSSSYCFGRYTGDHLSKARHVAEFPEMYTMKGREGALGMYRDKVELVRGGLIYYDEKDARRLAIDYKFPIEDLEEALQIGEQKIIEMDQKSSRLKRWMRKEKERLLMFGFASLFTIVSEATGFSQSVVQHNRESRRANSTPEKSPNLFDESKGLRYEIMNRIVWDMIVFGLGTTTGLGAYTVQDRRKRRKILENARRDNLL